MAMVYEWANGSKAKADAQKVGEDLRMMSAREGDVTPEMVVTYAKPKDSPLHDEFEWDDRIAAEAHRLEQARHIIRSLVIVSDGKQLEISEPTRAFLSIANPDAEEGGMVYRPLDVCVRQPDTMREILGRAKAELASWAARYRRFAKVAPLVAKVERIAGIAKKAKRR